MIGDKYGRWTIIGDVFKDDKNIKYCMCRCECGTVKRVNWYQLQKGTTTSCGCYNRELSRKICQRRNFRENRYETDGGVTKVYDARGNFFLIDTEDIEKIKPYYFMATKRYAVTCGKNTVLAHRIITSCPDGMVVDHINGNKLDNRKDNLRVCSHLENCWNRSNNISVCYIKERNKWRATIQVNGLSKHVGYYKTKEDAIEAKKKALELSYGEFSPSRRNEVKQKNA